MADQVVPEGNADVVNVIDPNGDVVGLPSSQVPFALQNGYRSATPEDVTKHFESEKYTSGMQPAIAGAEAIARGVFPSPLVSGAEIKSGLTTAEDIKGREEHNPEISGALEPAALVGSTLLSGGLSSGAKTSSKFGLEALTNASLLNKAGKLAKGAVGLGGEGAGALSNIAGHGIAGAAEGALYGVSNQVNEAILGDPNALGEKLLPAVTFNAVLGGSLGATVGAIGQGIKGVAGSEISQDFSDFKSRIRQHIENPEPVQAFNNELGEYYKNISSMADDVYGPKGLKAEEISKLMPEMSPKIANQVIDLTSKLEGTLNEMRSDPLLYPKRLVSKMERDFSNLQSVTTNPGASAADMFGALQDTKQSLQEYSKFDKFVKPVDEAYDFVNKAKDLGRDFRIGLEDPAVWGEAGERQQAINGAFKNFLPTLQSFEKKFTVKSPVEDPITGNVIMDRVYSPGRGETYLKQVGNPKAEITQKDLALFMKKAEEYRKVIEQTHENLGLEPAFDATPLNHVNQSLEKITRGAKMADNVIKKGLAGTAGRLLGGGLGGVLGSGVGHPAIGALIGEHALGPLFESMMPSIGKAMVGIHDGAEIATLANKSNRLSKIMKSSSEAIFHGGPVGSMILGKKREDNFEDRVHELKKNEQGFDKKMENLQKSTEALYKVAPNVSDALVKTATAAHDFLVSKIPTTPEQGPFSKGIEISDAAKGKFNKYYAVVSDPMTALSAVKENRFSSIEAEALNAVYPILYGEMKQEVMNSLLDHLDKGKSVPYDLRSNISDFLGMPLDSTMTGQSIMANQNMPAPQQPQTGMKPKHSMAKMGDIGKQDATPGQSREMYRSTVRA